jgi:NAD dependent epimerase/dehydratase family enzyme
MNKSKFDATLTGPITTSLAVYLREQAHHCTRLARNCSDRETSHALEVMGVEFLERATEIDQIMTIPAAGSDNAGSDS